MCQRASPVIPADCLRQPLNSNVEAVANSIGTVLNSNVEAVANSIGTVLGQVFHYHIVPDIHDSMARPLRLELAGVLYHSTSHGDGREDIFLYDDDRLAWLETLT